MKTRQVLIIFCTFFMFTAALAQPADRAKAPKISYALSKALTSTNNTDSIDVVLATKDFSKSSTSLKQHRVLSVYPPSGIMIIRTTGAQIKLVLADEYIQFADAVKKPKEELTTGYLDLSVNRLNYAHARYPQINGSGITASIKEQSFDTTDIDYKGRYINSGIAANTFTSHASIMATALAGAGNSSPYAKGAAPAAVVTSSSFASLLPDANDVFKRLGITIQNHSYGTVPESYYGAEAAAYDRSAFDNPTLLHVFSAGNSGNDTAAKGAYSGQKGVANLTGNFKQSKNTIAVGAIDSFYHVATASSKGPAYDGRVKPELVAFGEDGSSGAAAIVSGTAALVQQAYKSVFKMLPQSSLVKAVLINSADDVAVKGIDYASGYGSANGYAAVKTVLAQKVFENVVANGETKTFNIEVPANTAELKITIAWTDVPAPVNAAKSLVNDIDITAKNNAQSWLPWVLDAAPGSDILLRSAERKKDTLNNVEQITINHPAAGSYAIEVKGSHIQSANQSFAIAWQLNDDNYFEWTAPAKDDDVVANKSNVFRWMTTLSGKASLYYTTDFNNWKLVTDTVDLSQKYYKWIAPDTLSLAQLRMQTTATNMLSDTFVISKPLSLHTGFNCEDSFLLYWNPVAAQQYQLYSLGEKYLQSEKATADTIAIFNKKEHPSIYYSVSTVVSGRPGIKSFILNYTGEGTECYLKSFYLKLQEADKATFSASLGSLYGVKTVSLQKLVNGRFENVINSNNPTNTDFIFTDPSLTTGVNRYRVQVLLSSGGVAYSNEVVVYHFPTTSVIVYPNPAAQNQPVNIITNLAGRMKIEIYAMSGALVKQMQLTNILNMVPPFMLSKGMYIIKMTSDEGVINTQKLVVY